MLLTRRHARTTIMTTMIITYATIAKQTMAATGNSSVVASGATVVGIG
jgi:hypothetical protein